MKKLISYKNTLELKDSSFAHENIGQYSLCVQLQMEALDFLVLDKNEKLILYEAYRLDNIRDHKDLLEMVQLIFEGHHCLKAGFWKKVVVAFASAKYALFPADFEQEAAAALAFQTVVTDADVLGKDQVADIALAFAFPKVILAFFEQLYPNLSVSHQAFGFLSAIYQQPELLNEQHLHLLVGQKHLSFLFFKRGKLHFFNNFDYQDQKDFLYYVLLIYQSLELEHSQVALHLYGNFEADSSHIRQLHQHLKSVVLGNKPKTFAIGSDLLSLPSYQAVEVLGLYQK